MDYAGAVAIFEGLKKRLPTSGIFDPFVVLANTVRKAGQLGHFATLMSVGSDREGVISDSHVGSSGRPAISASWTIHTSGQWLSIDLSPFDLSHPPPISA